MAQMNLESSLGLEVNLERAKEVSLLSMVNASQCSAEGQSGAALGLPIAQTPLPWLWHQAQFAVSPFL